MLQKNLQTDADYRFLLAMVFRKMSTLKIVALGLVAFAFGTAAGVLFGRDE